MKKKIPLTILTLVGGLTLALLCMAAFIATLLALFQ